VRGIRLWWVLLLANLTCAVGVVYASHASLGIFHKIQEQRRIYQHLQTDWGRLLLEQSALVSYSRVEQLAAEELRMRHPDLSQTNLLAP